MLFWRAWIVLTLICTVPTAGFAYGLRWLCADYYNTRDTGQAAMLAIYVVILVMLAIWVLGTTALVANAYFSST